MAEIASAETTMGVADDLTADLRKVYGLKRLGRPGAVATPGVQPQAAPMPVVAQAQQETAMDRAQMARLYQASMSPLAPASSIRPMPNPAYAPVTSPRPAVNPNQPTAPVYSRGAGAVTIANTGRAPAPTYSRGTGGVTVSSQGRAPAPTYSRGTSGVKVTNTGRSPTKDKPKSGRI